jgi:hypothetical protein
MRRIHVAVVALLLGLAAVLGTFAATRTAGLGAASRHSQDALVRQRTQQLNAFEQSLRRHLAAGKPAQRVVYHRPPPVVVVRHTHHGDDGGFEAEGGGDD